MQTKNPHTYSTEEILKDLQTRKEGLNSSEVQDRLKTYGNNEIPQDIKYPFFKSLFKQVNSLLIYVLLAAAVISYIFDHPVDVYVILGVILINVCIGMYHDYKAHKVVSTLKSNIKETCRVIRDGVKSEISVRELVPGDIVEISDGDKVPADIRLIESHHIGALESSLTGESKSVSKNTDTLDESTLLGDRANMLFMGTYLVTGEGLGVVVNTGLNTEIGRITKDIQEIKEEKSLFQKRIDKLTRQMLLITFLTFASTFIVGLIRGIEIEELLMFAIASLVSGIPEGLPAVVTVVLSIASFRMSKKNAIVRNMPSIETLSTVDTIITDKTGTLTQNVMVVRKLVLPDKREIEIKGDGWSWDDKFYIDEDVKEILKLLGISTRGEVKEEDGKYIVMGDPTEASRYVLAKKGGVIKEDVLKEYEVLDELPYDQVLKFRSVLIKNIESNKRYLMIVGGAENVLDRSKVKEKDHFLNVINEHTQLGMRLQASAIKEVDVSINEIVVEDISNLEFSSIICIQDPVRNDVGKAVSEAQGAGIRVIMATGDHKNTAVAIAKEVGIIQESNGKYPLALNEDELNELSDDDFVDMVSNVSVFSRLTTSTKLRIAEVLQGQGHIVGMTGDGVNDAPVLKKADIGIAMGTIGTDAAREASDMVIVDDNFVSIVDAIREGRTVFANVRRTSLYLITTNIAEDIMIVLSVIAGFPLPLLPIQILWLNLVTDGVSDIALATEIPHNNVLKDKPRKSTDGILNKAYLKFIIFVSVIMVILSLSAFILLYYTKGLDEARTGTFLVMAFTQLFNMFNMRSLRESFFKLGVFSNRFVAWSFVVSTILLVLVTEVRIFANIFSFVTLRVELFIALFLISSLVLWLGELFKYVENRRSLNGQ